MATALLKREEPIMRLPIAIFLGFGLLSLTSCNEAPQAEPETSAPEAGSTALNTDSTPDPENAPHARGEEGHSHGSGHAARQPDSDGHDRHRGGSHGHGHAHADQPDEHSNTIAIGDKVPDFEVVIDGKKWKLSELQRDPAVTSDGTLVLTFWCSFCHSCRHVEQQLDSLAMQYRGKVGVIALDASAGETAEKVAAFAAKQGLTLPIALSSGGAAADIFGTRVTTTTVVIDGDGILRYCGQFGDRENSFAQDALEAVLAGEEVPVKKTRQKG
jgi:thiol-disulfide isomerase/thioredoxin